MDKNTFVEVLQASLLYFDGITEQELIKLGLAPKSVQIGIKLCDYLKNKETQNGK